MFEKLGDAFCGRRDVELFLLRGVGLPALRE